MAIISALIDTALAGGVAFVVFSVALKLLGGR